VNDDKQSNREGHHAQVNFADADADFERKEEKKKKKEEEKSDREQKHRYNTVVSTLNARRLVRLSAAQRCSLVCRA
jgi:hypothetical protein